MSQFRLHPKAKQDLSDFREAVAGALQRNGGKPLRGLPPALAKLEKQADTGIRASALLSRAVETGQGSTASGNKRSPRYYGPKKLDADLWYRGQERLEAPWLNAERCAQWRQNNTRYVKTYRKLKYWQDKAADVRITRAVRSFKPPSRKAVLIKMREFIDRARAAGSEGTWFKRTNVRFWDSSPSGPRFDLALTYGALLHADADSLLYDRALRLALKRNPSQGK